MIAPQLWLLITVLTSQLATVSYWDALPLYETLEQAENIIARHKGEIITELPDELKSIAFCESRFRHFISNKVIHSKTSDIGIMQINLPLWKKKAESMGLNLYEKSDNIKFGKFLYEQNGLKDWSASKRCWSKLNETSLK